MRPHRKRIFQPPLIGSMLFRSCTVIIDERRPINSMDDVTLFREKIGHEWSFIGWNLSETLLYLMTFEYAKFANLSRPYLVPRLTRHRTRMKQTNRNLSKLPGGNLNRVCPLLSME